MSGHDDSCNCPNCGEYAHRYIDWKPYDYTEITCLACGLRIRPILSYMYLEELNERRIEEEDLKPLTELPEQHKEF